MDDFKKSISAILYSRLTSPLFGSFFFSWLVWNWKILLVLFFVDADQLYTTKFEYIEECLLNSSTGLWYPIASTLFIILIYPWIEEVAYKLSLWFKRRKNEFKQTLENEQLLSVEQSIQLRMEIANQNGRFKDMLAEKDREIQIRDIQIDELSEQLEQLKEERRRVIDTVSPLHENSENSESATQIIIKKLVELDLLRSFEDVAVELKKSKELRDSVEISKFLGLGLIEYKSAGYNVGKTLYALTDLGNDVLHEIAMSN